MNMPPATIDRIAKAMADYMARDHRCDPWDAMDERQRNEGREAIRAGLAALTADDLRAALARLA